MTELALVCRQVQLAVLLVEAGASFVIVGGTSRLLQGTTRRPHDLDIVVTPAQQHAIRQALEALGAALPPSRGLSPVRVVTSWSTIDVFPSDVAPRWSTIVVDGTELQVADE